MSSLPLMVDFECSIHFCRGPCFSFSNVCSVSKKECTLASLAIKRFLDWYHSICFRMCTMKFHFQYFVLLAGLVSSYFFPQLVTPKYGKPNQHQKYHEAQKNSKNLQSVVKWGMDCNWNFFDNLLTWWIKIF